MRAEGLRGPVPRIRGRRSLQPRAKDYRPGQPRVCGVGAGPAGGATSLTSEPSPGGGRVAAVDEPTHRSRARRPRKRASHPVNMRSGSVRVCFITLTVAFNTEPSAIPAPRRSRRGCFGGQPRRLPLDRLIQGDPDPVDTQSAEMEGRGPSDRGITRAWAATDDPLSEDGVDVLTSPRLHDRSPAWSFEQRRRRRVRLGRRIDPDRTDPRPDGCYGRRAACNRRARDDLVT
jgi:hypothetical protein